MHTYFSHMYTHTPLLFETYKPPIFELLSSLSIRLFLFFFLSLSLSLSLSISRSLTFCRVASWFSSHSFYLRRHCPRPSARNGERILDLFLDPFWDPIAWTLDDRLRRPLSSCTRDFLNLNLDFPTLPARLFEPEFRPMRLPARFCRPVLDPFWTRFGSARDLWTPFVNPFLTQLLSPRVSSQPLLTTSPRIPCTTLPSHPLKCNKTKN